MLSQAKYICITLAVSLALTFVCFNKVKLFSIGDGDLFLNQYVDASRHTPWDKVIRETGDDFLIHHYGNEDPQAVPFYNPYVYQFLPGYILHKAFHLRGEQLWLIHSLFTSLIGVASTLLVFGIANCLFGARVAFISAILFSFSPHIWISYNFYAEMRGYNVFFSLLPIFLFLRYEQKGGWPYLVGSGTALGISFLFFHVGSFASPIIIVTYCVLRSILDKTIIHSKKIFVLTLMAVSVAAFLEFSHSVYFRLDQSTTQRWLEWYAVYAGGSHQARGILLFDISLLAKNIGTFFMAVFINRMDADHHYIHAPPQLPLIYSYFVSAFSIPGLWALFHKKRKENIFLLTWLFFFILVYSLIIEVRIKNLFMLIPPFMILAAYGSEISIRHVIRLSQRLKFHWPWISNLPAAILLTGSVLIGSYYIFIKIPGKNFYGGASVMGNYQIYNHIKERGYSSNTTIMLSQVNEHRPHMGLRLFTQGVPKFKNLLDFGIVAWPGGAPEAVKIQKMERELLKTSDKIFYCFQYWTDFAVYTYVDAEQLRESFVIAHPNLKPFIINGLDGKPLWRIYEVAETQAG